MPSASHRWRSTDDLKLPLRISCYSAGHSSNNFQSGWWRGFRRFGKTRRHERASRRLQRRRSKDADEPVTMATETTIRPADPIQLTRAPTKQRLAERRLAGPHPARNRRPERGTTGRGWSSPAAPSLKEQHSPTAATASATNKSQRIEQPPRLSSALTRRQWRAAGITNPTAAVDRPIIKTRRGRQTRNKDADCDGQPAIDGQRPAITTSRDQDADEECSRNDGPDLMGALIQLMTAARRWLLGPHGASAAKRGQRTTANHRRRPRSTDQALSVFYLCPAVVIGALVAGGAVS